MEFKSIVEAVRRFYRENREEVLLVLAVILFCMLSFGLGYIWGARQQKVPLKFEG